MPLNYETLEIDHKVAAIVTEDSARIYDYSNIEPVEIKKGYRGYIPWGEENEQPLDIVNKIRYSDVMSPNMQFNVLSAYGNGFQMRMKGEPIGQGEVTDEDVLKWFRRNNMTKYLLEQFTDHKYFAWSVCLLILTNDGSKIARIKHKEAFHGRFEENNPKTGKIENIFFADWEDSPDDKDTQAYPVLDYDDPYTDLMVRMGKEPDPTTGKIKKPTSKRIFAIITQTPVPGYKYYPFPFYASHFLSGWYDISRMIPVAKRAKMENGMSVKYHVEFHKNYFDELYKAENIVSPEEKKARRVTEFNNIKEFLSGVENSGKVWYSGYYIDPNGKENRMIRITVVDSSKEGGDWIEDQEEASNMQCYSMMVHPSLIGAVPGKTSSSISGTDKRELFTMKQSLDKAFRDLMLIPFDVIQEYNEWPMDIVFDIPHMMLTTLDVGVDAIEVSTENKE